MERLAGEYQEVRRREKVDLTAEDRARILSLAKDLPAVWNAATTTHAERKNLLRMVLREVTLSPIEVPTRLTRVQLLWQTGAVSNVTVQRKDKYTAQATPAPTLALIHDLYLRKTQTTGRSLRNSIAVVCVRASTTPGTFPRSAGLATAQASIVRRRKPGGRQTEATTDSTRCTPWPLAQASSPP
jgi:hypothetical protein